MKKIPLLLATSLALLTTGCITVYADSLDFKEKKQLSLNASGLKNLEIDATAGFLIVTGSDVSQIEVTADIETFNDRFKLSLEAKGDTAVLKADLGKSHSFNWGDNHPKIDLTVKVPMDINLIIDDGSGSITISKVKSISKLDDGSGSIKISEVGGNVNIEDGSGSLDIRNIQGNVEIDDGSGSIIAEKITGYLKVEDGSGSMGITDVGGLVTIDDGSGNINLSNLRNGLTIIEEGSGGLKMNDIKGPVSIK